MTTFWLFLFLMGFMAWRSFSYFRAGRAIAGIAASFGVLLFAGAIFVDFATHTSSAEPQVARATTAKPQAPSQPVIADYAPDKAYVGDGFTPEEEL